MAVSGEVVPVSEQTEFLGNLIDHAGRGNADALRLLRLVLARAAEKAPPAALLRLAQCLAREGDTAGAERG